MLMGNAWICCVLGLAGALLWLALTAPAGVASLTLEHPVVRLQEQSESRAVGDFAPSLAIITRNDLLLADSGAHSPAPTSVESVATREAESTAKPKAPPIPQEHDLALAHALGWQNDPAQIERLTVWIKQHEEGLRSAHQTLISALAQGAGAEAACTNFNHLAGSQADDLVLRFGRPAAVRIARSVGLYRVDALSKEIVRLDLDGNVIACISM